MTTAIIVTACVSIAGAVLYRVWSDEIDAAWRGLIGTDDYPEPSWLDQQDQPMSTSAPPGAECRSRVGSHDCDWVFFEDDYRECVHCGAEGR